MSSTPNANPINSIYSLNGVPLFTYGMIGITTIALACMTMMDDSNKSYAKDEGFEQSKTESSPFSFFSSKKSEEEPQESMFSFFGKEESKKEESQGSILPSFGKEESKKEEPQESMFSFFGKEESKKEEPQGSILPSFSSETKEVPKQGGKYRKTKYNLQKYQHNKSKKVYN